MYFKVSHDLIMGVIDTPDQKPQYVYYNCIDGLLAIDCIHFNTIMKFFYISPNEILQNAPKWTDFATNHLSSFLQEEIKRFVNRVGKIVIFN